MGIYVELAVAAVVLIVFAIRKWVKRNSDFWEKDGIPALNRPYGNMKGLWYMITQQKNMVDLDLDMYQAMGKQPYGGTVDFGIPSLIVKDVDLIKQILVKDFDHFVDRRQMKLDAEPIINHMLTSLAGQEWKNVRSHMSPTFTTGKIKRMFENFNKCGTSLIEFIKSKPVGSPGSRDVVIKEFVSRYLVDVIGATAFGMDTNALKDNNSKFYEMVQRSSQFSAMKMAKAVVMLMLPFLTKLGFRFTDAKSFDFFEDILRDALKRRKASGEKWDDFLQMMIEAQKGELKLDESELDAFEKDAMLTKAGEKPQGKLTDDIIVAQCVLFFIAGLDTTGGVLCNAYYILALHQDIQEKIYEEVSGAVKDGKFDYEAIGKMEYMDKVINETLRMYPPGTRLERRCTRDWTIPGTNKVVKKDALVGLSVVAMHRDPELYPEPEKFDPERFTTEAKGARNPYTYLPFGQGPRNCIGMRFALMEAKVALAYVVYNFLIEPSEKTPIPLKVDPTFGVRPDITVELRFKERSN